MAGAIKTAHPVGAQLAAGIKVRSWRTTQMRTQTNYNKYFRPNGSLGVCCIFRLLSLIGVGIPKFAVQTGQRIQHRLGTTQYPDRVRIAEKG